MMDASKYHIGYYPPPVEPGHVYEWTQKDHIETAPAWCSVDLRDGNQSLVVPMSLEEKLEFYDMLLKIGFKEIEVGFPAASETEYEFLRKLIDEDRIPEDVTIQVLTQCRDHIIRRTFEAVKGAPRAIIHFYNSTSEAQRREVFHKSKEEIKQIAVDGAKLVKQLSEEYEGNFLFEYSPESFTGTEPEYAVEVCNAVLDVMQPTPDRPMIINLPVTVEMSMPHIYANQIEWCSKHLKYRDAVILSTHPHNDRGCGVADAELAVLAGAQRVECCLFGNGERTGNVDAITLAMNMYSHGVDPKLDFSDMPAICEVYERVTRMHVYERSPYAGSLVFAAFSGSHQDAIAKGMTYRKETHLHRWDCPYIPIDPHDISRTYDADVIRINSQSGKGGIGFLLQQNYGYNPPPHMREQLGYRVKEVSDHEPQGALRPGGAGGLRGQLPQPHQPPQRHRRPLHPERRRHHLRQPDAAGRRPDDPVRRHRQRPPGRGGQRHRAGGGHGLHPDPLQRARPGPGHRQPGLQLRGPEVARRHRDLGLRHPHGHHRGGRPGAGQRHQQPVSGGGDPENFIKQTEANTHGNDHDTKDPGGPLRAGDRQGRAADRGRSRHRAGQRHHHPGGHQRV